MNAQPDAYEQYKRAQRSGGPCENCGWREGDGVRECYYSDSVGSVRHSNRHPAGLSPQQSELYWLHVSPPNPQIVYFDEGSREREIESVVSHREASFQRSLEAALKHGWRLPRQEEEDKWRENWVAQQRAIPTLTEVRPELGDVCAERLNKSGNLAILYRRHRCSGHPIERGPYVIGCTGCDVVIRLWEHGVDYDVG